MGKYLPLLILLACPLMMIFMMRGMHGGHDKAAEDPDPRHEAPAPGADLPAEQRILVLERQIAELRAARDGAARRP